MIVYGWKRYAEHKFAGAFHCPKCDRLCHCSGYQISQDNHLYHIRLWKDVRECLVECARCGSCFAVEKWNFTDFGNRALIDLVALQQQEREESELEAELRSAVMARHPRIALLSDTNAKDANGEVVTALTAKSEFDVLEENLDSFLIALAGGRSGYVSKTVAVKVFDPAKYHRGLS